MSTTRANPKTGVLGLGAMGLGSAHALLEAGHAVYGYDPNPTALDGLTAAGGQACTSPAEVAQAVEVLVVVVVNAQQVEQCLWGENGAAAHLKPGSVVVQCSTVASSFIEGQEARLAEHGVLLLDAPISGGAVKARGGELSVMASGSEAAFDKARFALDAMAAKVYRLGENAGVGSRFKLVNQLLAGVHIAAAAEAISLGIKSGIDPETVYEVIRNSAGNSWMFENRVPHILEGDYSPRSAVNIFVKDLGLVCEAGQELSFPLPMASAALQLFTGAKGSGYGLEDDSAVVKLYADQSGIRLPESGAGDETGGGGQP